MGALHGTFIVLFQQDGADESCDGLFIGEDADHLGAMLDLAVQALDGVRAVQRGSVFLGEGHVGQNVGFGELGQPGT